MAPAAAPSAPPALEFFLTIYLTYLSYDVRIVDRSLGSSNPWLFLYLANNPEANIQDISGWVSDCIRAICHISTEYIGLQLR